MTSKALHFDDFWWVGGIHGNLCFTKVKHRFLRFWEVPFHDFYGTFFMVSTFSLFSILFTIFSRKCAKMGTRRRSQNSEISPKILPLISEGPSGVPWGAQGHQNGAQGYQNGAQGHQNDSQRTPKWPQMDATMSATNRTTEYHHTTTS